MYELNCLSLFKTKLSTGGGSEMWDLWSVGVSWHLPNKLTFHIQLWLSTSMISTFSFVLVFVCLCDIDTQRQTEEKHSNVSLEQRFHELEVHYSEATTLLHLQGTLILDLQVGTNYRYRSQYLYTEKKKTIYGCLLSNEFCISSEPATQSDPPNGQGEKEPRLPC